MGWKASMIIVHKPSRQADEQLLREIGFKGLAAVDKQPVEAVINPDANKVYLGMYNDNLLICDAGVPLQFFENTETSAERQIAQLFPNSEICVITLHSAVNLWGYTVIQNGRKIRARAGSADDGTFIDIGAPLAEERELLAQATAGNDGTLIYKLDDFPDETFTEDQVGENFVFSVCARYFDEQLDSADELLFDTYLTGYSYKSVTYDGNRNDLQTPPSKDKVKPWWKLW